MFSSIVLMSVPRMLSEFLLTDFRGNLWIVTVYGVIWGRAIRMGELEEIGRVGWIRYFFIISSIAIVF